MGKYLLLVEDDPDDVALTTSALLDDGFPFGIEVAPDGAEAVRWLEDVRDGKRARPAAVVLDLKLPKMGGLEVLRWMLSGDGIRGIPVAILTSSSHPADQEQAKELGVRFYLLKPTDLSGYKEIAVKLRLLVAQA